MGAESICENAEPSRAAHGFETTLWSVVARAQQNDAESGPALERLCRAYWYPLYAYVRRRGFSPHDAQDLTQEFFARLLARDALRNVSPDKGRFRSFLLASLKHFMSDEWDRARALKRGGGAPPISLDGMDPEARYQYEPAEESSAEKIYDRRWAMTLIGQALARLEREYGAEGKQALFEALQTCLQSDRNGGSHREIGARLGMTEGAVKVAAHRLRRRYRDLLRAEIAQTVCAHADIEAELQDLFAALG